MTSPLDSIWTISFDNLNLTDIGRRYEDFAGVRIVERLERNVELSRCVETEANVPEMNNLNIIFNIGTHVKSQSERQLLAYKLLIDWSVIM